jgi:hypothetical protein
VDSLAYDKVTLQSGRRFFQPPDEEELLLFDEPVAEE